MDSSSVAAIACQIRKQELPNLKIQAFTAVYDRIHPDRERYYAGLVAQKLGLPIHYFVCDGYPLLLPPTATVEPLEDYTPAMRLEMVRQASSLGRVLLTGNSADNLLMCSSIGSLFPEMNPFSIAFQVIRLWKLFGKRPPLGLGLMAKLKGKDSPSYDYPSWLNPDFETKLNLKERWQYGWKHQPAPLHRRHPQVHLSLVSPDWRSETECFSPNDFTPYEERDPFLDWRLVEFILSLPTLPWLFQKYVLRQGMRRSLPLEVITRPKTPLGSVHDSLLEQPEATWVDWWQPDPRLLSYTNPKKIPSMGRGSLEARDSYIHLRPLLLNIWLQQH
jgi:asparagine synthase (glutamine-hydrolysing)